MLSVAGFAQWEEPAPGDFFTASNYAKEFKVSEAGGDTTVYYLLNIEAPGFLSNATCSSHAQWETHAALKTTGSKFIVEKYIETEIIQPEEDVEGAKADTVVHPWDGKTYTISGYGNFNSRGNMYYKIFPTSWSTMFVDRASQADYMWEILSQGNGVFRIKPADVNPAFNNDSTARYFGLESYDGYLAFNTFDNDYLDNNVMAIYPMLDPKLGEMIDIEASDNLLSLLQGVDAKIDWAFISEDEYAKYYSAVTAYNYAETFLANIEAIEADYPFVDTETARSIYHNYNVSTYEEMKAAEADMNAQVLAWKLKGLEGATAEDPRDGSNLIVNATFDVIGDFTGWSGTAFGAGGTTSTCAEHYNKTYDTYQDIEGLPAGRYKFSVQGYYRRGSASNDWSLQTSENPDAQRYAIFYIVTGENDTTSVPIVSASSGAVVTSFGGATSSVGDYVIPNTMEAANYWFQNGYYMNEINLILEDGGDVRIGVKKDAKINDNDWSIFDNFSLLYYGPIEGDLDYAILQTLISECEAKYPNLDDVRANADVKEAYEEALEEAKDAVTDCAEYNEKLTEAVTALNASVAAYTTVKAAMTRCESEQERFEGTSFAGLGEEFGDLLMTLEDGYNDGNAEEVLADEPYNITIPELTSFMDKMIVDYITANVSAGDEITLLINNPSFDSRFRDRKSTRLNSSHT